MYPRVQRSALGTKTERLTKARDALKPVTPPRALSLKRIGFLVIHGRGRLIIQYQRLKEPFEGRMEAGVRG